jgi:regulator of sirC expression with transglutaminase-like and TPR domain
VTSGAAREVVRAAGLAGDGELNLAETALALAVLDRPDIDLAAYRTHLAVVHEQIRAEAADVSGAEAAAGVLRRVLAETHGYTGDTENYDDAANADLSLVIDRRRGLPVALGIIYIDAGRAAGWDIAGTRFPGHFLLRLDLGGGRAVIDPFAGGETCDAVRLREIAKQVIGPGAELSPDYLVPAGDREILLRLLNNLRTRAVRAGALDRAAEVLGRMILLAPQSPELHRDDAILQASRGNLGDAIAAGQRYLDCAGHAGQRAEAEALLERLRRRLN